MRDKTQQGTDIQSGQRGGGRRGQAASAMLGGMLLSYGLKQRSMGGMALALAGGGIIYRGTRGRTLMGAVPGLRARVLRRGREAAVQGRAEVLQRSITIGRPTGELYRAWRAAGNLSQVMGHFAEVTDVAGDLQHWKVMGPRGRSFEWDSHIVEEHPGELLRWESAEGADVASEGSVQFRPAPGDWGTVVTLRLRIQPPGGALGEAVMKLLGDVPGLLAHKALKRFKSLVETGEIPTTRTNPAARGDGYSY